MGKEVSLAGIEVSEGANKDDAFAVMSGASKPKPLGRDTKPEPGNRQCVLCPKILDTRPRMREHVLNHYKPQILLSLPRERPFTCPECNSHKRDKITLLRHYAFTHKHIYEYSNDKELLGKLVGEAASVVLDAPEVSSDGDKTGEETRSQPPIASSPIIPSNPLSYISLNVLPRPNAPSPSSALAPIGVYMCPLCDYITDQEVELKDHTEVIHEPEYSSDQSDPDIEVLESPSGEKRIDIGNYPCTICLVYAADSLSDLKDHGEKFHHTSLGNVTRTWDKEANNQKYNDRDQNMHEALNNCEGYDIEEEKSPAKETHNEKQCLCTSCTFSAKHVDKLNKHIRAMHHFLSNNPYEKFPKNIKCIHCPHISKKLSCLRAHVQLEHQNHTCSRCDFVTLYFQDLKNHTKRLHKTSLKIETYWFDRKTLKDRAKMAGHCACHDCHNQNSKGGRIRHGHGKPANEFIKEDIGGKENLESISDQLDLATDELEEVRLNRVQKKQNRVPIKIKITATHNHIVYQGKRPTETKKLRSRKMNMSTPWSTPKKRGRPPMPKKVFKSKKQKHLQETTLGNADMSNMICVNYLEIAPGPRQETLEDPRVAHEETDPLSLE